MGTTRSPGTVLVVDDEEVICNTVRIYLESEGFHVRTVYSGREALDALASASFEVVILDILMPQMNGLEVMQRIRDGGLPVEVIVTTGAGSHDVAVEAMRLGAFALLRKPILDFEEKLLLAVRQATDRCRLRVALARERERAEHLNGCLDTIYRLGQKLLRARRREDALALLSEAVEILFGRVDFILYARGAGGRYEALGRPDVPPLPLDEPPQFPFNKAGLEVPLEPCAGLFPLLVAGQTVGILALGGAKDRQAPEFLPILSILPAVACCLVSSNCAGEVRCRATPPRL